MKEKFYLTTAIAYPNAKPHMGHFLEFIEADTLARYKKMQGFDVFFLTGTDEHGSKIAQTAKQKGVDPQSFVDESVLPFPHMKETCNIEYSDFIRTTQERHKKTAQGIWMKLFNNGDIYKKKYTGLYCVGCESFKTEKELVQGICPDHNAKPTLVEEENYFFRLSKYTDALIGKLESGELEIVPSFRKTEIVNVARSGLLDVSFSRPKETLPWGIEVPNNSDHVIYVWCDALINYLSGIGYSDNPSLFEKLWPADVHIIGKDISRFHALIWPAMLLSAGIALPKKIFIHEFVTSQGKKMSKTLGNIVDPFEVIDYYGAEALRFFLLKETVKGEDIDFTWTRFHNTYEAELVNGVGNLANRILVLTHKYLRGRVPAVYQNDEMAGLIQQAWREYHTFFSEFDFKGALENCLSLVYFSNRFITEKEPWALFKKDSTEFNNVMFVLLGLLGNIALMLHPFTPDISTKLQKSLGVTLEKLSIPYGKVREGFRVEQTGILFPKKESIKK